MTQCRIGRRSHCAENELNPSIGFCRTSACDRQTDRHRAVQTRIQFSILEWKCWSHLPPSSNVSPSSQNGHSLVWYGMVNVDLYSTVITKVSNALNTLVSGEKPGFQAPSKGLIVLLCAEVIRQGVPDHAAVHSECSASNSGLWSIANVQFHIQLSCIC